MSTNETKSKSVNSGEVTTSITGDKITLSDEYKYHDYFNIINFASIVVIDIFYIIYSTEWHKIGTNQLAQDANCTKIFTLMSSFTANYLLWDTLFVYIYPTCVMDDTSTKEKMAKGKNHARNIIIHHLITLLYLSIPFFIPQFHWHTGVLLLVEINTLFLTIRRHLFNNTLVYKIINALFYISWILFRLVIFPLFVFFITSEYFRYSIEVNTYINIFVIAPILQVMLTSLGFFWTYKLFFKAPKVKV
jgi:hypothetical protein